MFGGWQLGNVLWAYLGVVYLKYRLQSLNSVGHIHVVLPDVVKSGMNTFCPLFPEETKPNLPLPQEADGVVLQHVEFWGY